MIAPFFRHLPGFGIVRGFKGALLEDSAKYVDQEQSVLAHEGMLL